MVEKILLLLTNDSEQERLVYTQILSDIICLIKEAQNGAETLALLKEDDFDCIILDYYLSDYNGVDFIKEIRSKGHKIPIVVTTSDISDMEIVEIMKAGAQDYVPKNKVNALLSRAVISAIEKQKKVIESEYYQSFYYNAPVGFFTTSIDEGRVIKGNFELLKILGYEKIEDLPLMPKLYVNPDDRVVMFDEISKNGKISNFEIQMNTKKGKKWVSITAKFCLGATSLKCLKCLPNCPQTKCIEGSVIDITDEIELENQINEFKLREIESLKELQKIINLKIKDFDQL